MPDPTGLLSPEEHQKAINIVNTKWKPAVPCDLCGSIGKWTAGWYIVSPLPLANGNKINVGGMIYPSVPVFCQDCGNTKYINAIITGIYVAPVKQNA